MTVGAENVTGPATVMRPVCPLSSAPILSGAPIALSVVWPMFSVPAALAPTPIVVASVTPSRSIPPLPVMEALPPASGEREMALAVRTTKALLPGTDIVAPCDWLMLPPLAAVRFSVPLLGAVTAAEAPSAMLVADRVVSPVVVKTAGAGDRSDRERAGGVERDRAGIGGQVADAVRAVGQRIGAARAEEREPAGGDRLVLRHRAGVGDGEVAGEGRADGLARGRSERGDRRGSTHRRCWRCRCWRRTSRNCSRDWSACRSRPIRRESRLRR